MVPYPLMVVSIAVLAATRAASVQARSLFFEQEALCASRLGANDSGASEVKGVEPEFESLMPVSQSRFSGEPKSPPPYLFLHKRQERAMGM